MHRCSYKMQLHLFNGIKYIFLNIIDSSHYSAYKIVRVRGKNDSPLRQSSFSHLSLVDVNFSLNGILDHR